MKYLITVSLSLFLICFYKYITAQIRIFAVHGGMEWISLANFALFFNQRYVPFLPLPSLQTPLSPPRLLYRHADNQSHTETYTQTQFLDINISNTKK